MVVGEGGEEERFRREIPSSKYDLEAKMDACVDLTLRRALYSSLAGAFTGLLLFRSPVTRRASVAFGAGVGIGSAYIESSYIFGGAPTKWSTQNASVIPSAHEPTAVPMPEDADKSAGGTKG